jgi:hypothetical protein
MDPQQGGKTTTATASQSLSNVYNLLAADPAQMLWLVGIAVAGVVLIALAFVAFGGRGGK